MCVYTQLELHKRRTLPSKLGLVGPRYFSICYFLSPITEWTLRGTCINPIIMFRANGEFAIALRIPDLPDKKSRDVRRRSDEGRLEKR